jgi:hypothetical protein
MEESETIKKRMHKPFLIEIKRAEILYKKYPFKGKK